MTANWPLLPVVNSHHAQAVRVKSLASAFETRACVCDRVCVGWGREVMDEIRAH